MPAGKPSLHKDETSPGIKCVWNYRAAVSMPSYLKGSTQTKISIYVHQCARFCNNPCLVNERTVIQIANYLANSVHICGFTRWKSKVNHVSCSLQAWYIKYIECYVDSDFESGWDQSDANNLENPMLSTGYVITYVGYPVL